jgi:D-glycero-beta-D-manno-heptose 1-phosphate adenylyltransferase
MKLPAPGFERKIARPEELGSRIAELARPIVFTNGVFDILHRGHVTYLAQARALGASLVVAVNSDASVRTLGKGDDRPLNTALDRAALLAALESVTLVTAFDESVPLEPLDIVRPDIYVKGGDYNIAAIPEAEAVAKWGGRSIAIAFEHERSTTSFLARLRATRRAEKTPS